MTKSEKKKHKQEQKLLKRQKRAQKVKKYTKAKRKKQARKERKANDGIDYRARRSNNDSSSSLHNSSQFASSSSSSSSVVQSRLKQHSQKSKKKGVSTSGKVAKEQRSTKDHVLDNRTLKILFKWIQQGHLNEIEGCIRTGKEANCYYASGGNLTLCPKGWAANTKKQIDYESEDEDAIDPEILLREKEEMLMTSATSAIEAGGKPPEDIAVKIFKTTMAEFKNRAEYVEGDYRFRNANFSSQNSAFKTCKLWAEKEFKNLLRIHKSGIPSPKPLRLQDHVFSMELIGRRGIAAPQLREANLSAKKLDKMYIQVVAQMRTLYQECGLVHGDLSEYNLLYYKSQVWMIDVGQAVQLTHPQATKFLHRDIKNVTDWFCRKRVSHCFTYRELYQFITASTLDENSLPVGLKAELVEKRKKKEMERKAILVEKTKSFQEAVRLDNQELAKELAVDVAETRAMHERLTRLDAYEELQVYAKQILLSNSAKPAVDVSEGASTYIDIDLHQSVFGSGWKAAVHGRMGTQAGVTEQEVIQAMGDRAVGMASLAPAIEESLHVEEHENEIAVSSSEENRNTKERVSKSVKRRKNWFYTTQTLRVGMRARVCADEQHAIRECRKTTVRGAGATTLLWGSRTKAERIRRQGLGKVVSVLEIDTSDKSVRVLLDNNGVEKETWYPVACLEPVQSANENGMEIENEKQEEQEVDECKEDAEEDAEEEEGASSSDECDEETRKEMVLAIESLQQELANAKQRREKATLQFQISELQAELARFDLYATLEAELEELHEKRDSLTGRKNKPKRRKIDKEIAQIEEKMEELEEQGMGKETEEEKEEEEEEEMMPELEPIHSDQDDEAISETDEDDEATRQEMMEAIESLSAQYNSATSEEEKNECKIQIDSLKEQLEDLEKYSSLEAEMEQLELEIEKCSNKKKKKQLQRKVKEIEAEMERIEEKGMQEEESSDGEEEEG
eukprot:g256.t1